MCYSKPSGGASAERAHHTVHGGEQPPAAWVLRPERGQQAVTEIEEHNSPFTTSRSTESNIDTHVRRAEQVILPPRYQAYLSAHF